MTKTDSYPNKNSNRWVVLVAEAPVVLVAEVLVAEVLVVQAPKVNDHGDHL